MIFLLITLMWFFSCDSFSFLQNKYSNRARERLLFSRLQVLPLNDFSTQFNALNISTEDSAKGDLPFFPQTLEDIAEQVCFSVRYALMNNVVRLRVDYSLSLFEKERYELRWLLIMAGMMIDDDFNKNVHVFVDHKFDLQYVESVWKDVWESVLNKGDKKIKGQKRKKAALDRLRISHIDCERINDDDSIFILYKPNNIESKIKYNKVVKPAKGH